MTALGLLFDMDGVIADTNQFHKETIRIFCEQHGVSVTDQVLREKVFGRVNRDWIPAIFPNLTEATYEQLADEKEALFREQFAPHLEEVKGLTSFLSQMKREGVKMVVGTSAPPENADFILEGLKISSFFDAVLNSSHIKIGKPDPEIYLKSAAAIGLPPEKCIVFEDSLSGVEAGIAAGCKVIAVTTTHSREEFAHAHLVIDDFEGLNLNALQQLFQLSD